jgi:hypothetical protein
VKLDKVKSSAVKRMGFSNGVLTVQYASGGTYRYSGHTKAEFNRVEHAGSIGKSLSKLLGIHGGTK